MSAFVEGKFVDRVFDPRHRAWRCWGPSLFVTIALLRRDERAQLRGVEMLRGSMDF